MSLLVDVATYLVAQLPDDDLVIGTNLFMGQAPDEPDAIVVVYERPGAPVHTMGAEDGERHDPALEMPRLQVMVRTSAEATAYPTGSDLIYRIYRTLSVANIVLTSGERYLIIEPMGMPGPMDEDKQGRIKFVANFSVTKEPTAL